MKVGIVGLGAMGHGIASRMCAAGFKVIGFDPDKQALQKAQALGVQVVDTLDEVGKQATVMWLMVPAGTLVDSILQTLCQYAQPGAIIIDGGNSNYHDSIRRAAFLEKQEISYLDCGTSGGLHGEQYGYCLMVGGKESAYAHVSALLEAVAAPQGVAYVGPSGAGHYVKMVHNGIEYALLQAYAEGFHVLRKGAFADQLDLLKIAQLWNQGSIIRSWIVQLIQEVYQQTDDHDFKNISGAVAQGDTGRWAVEDAHAHNIPVPLMEHALQIRAWSRDTDGNYATQLVALLRYQFGGHPVKKRKE